MLTRLVAGILAAALVGLPAHAFPSRDITVLIPYGPGGGFDTVVRRIAPRLREILGVEVIPTNMPGANGRRAAAVLMNAEPDGHTIMIFNIPGHGLDYIRGAEDGLDIQAVTWLGQVGEDRYVVMGAANNPNITEILDVPRLGRPILIPDQGPTATSHMANQIVWSTLGVEHSFITGYASSQEYTTAVLRGDGDVAMAVGGSAVRFNEANDFNILAELSNNPETRLFPDAPNGTDIGHPELDQLGLLRVIGGPPGMPDDIVHKLSDALVEAVNHPETQAWATETNNPMIALDAAAATEAVRAALEFQRRFADLFADE